VADVITVKELYNSRPDRHVYLPSVLIIANSSTRTRRFKRLLENDGCQVDWITPYSDNLAATTQKYFDLVVLILERIDQYNVELYRKLKAYPELAQIPFVILAAYLQEGILNRSKLDLVYCIPEDAAAEAKIKQIIGEIYYLSRRYT
jgi:CheY-like chemotaxis protein